jgi:LDH2 family malate/lactate/ureidoglycolate dehydrogenase
MTPAPDLVSHADPEGLRRFCERALRAVGADTPSSVACTRSMLHGSIHGVDSHGVRLLPHYVAAMKGGRLNGTPTLRFTRTRPGAGMLDGDHAQGALPSYTAAGHAADLAAEAGIGAVGIFNSSHFGPAGAYALEIAHRGMVGLVFCNADAYVRLHDGAEGFHGTNPIAMAAPVAEGDPWLFDMATSAVPYNRVLLHRSMGMALPEGVASDGDGRDTCDPAATAMLTPLGGAFGWKGAGLAGMAEILSAVLTGGGLSRDLLPMGGPDLSTPRGLGAFVTAIDPAAFAGAEAAAAAMARYLGLLRGSKPAEGGKVMAPGDREWETARRRWVEGVPLDPETVAGFRSLAAELGLDPPALL